MSPIKMYLSWVNSRSGNRYHTHTGVAVVVCGEGHVPIPLNRQSAFVDMCALPPVSSECIQWRLAVCNSLSNGHCTTRIPIIQLQLSVVLLLCHAPADRGRSGADMPYVWGYCTADLRISSLWLIIENIVWPQLVKVKPTRPGTDFSIPWLSPM